MFDIPLVQTALGVLLVFVLFSLLVSAIQEMAVALLNSRGAALWDSLATLFGDDSKGDAARDAVLRHPLLRTLVAPSSWSRLKPGVSRRSTPSYIPASAFATAVLDLLRKPHETLAAFEGELRAALLSLQAGQMIPEDLKARIQAAARMIPTTSPVASSAAAATNVVEAPTVEAQLTALQQLLDTLRERWKAAIVASAESVSADFGGTIRALADNTAGGIVEFRQAIEGWFDQAMAGVSGWYKRWTMAVQLGIGCVLALSLNIDTVNIVRELSGNAALRAAVAVRAVDFAGSEEPGFRVVRGFNQDPASPVSVRSSQPERFEILLPPGSGGRSVTVTPSGPVAQLISCASSATLDPGPSPEAAVLACRVDAEQLSTRQRVEVAVDWTEADATARHVDLVLFAVPGAARQYEEQYQALQELGLPIGRVDGRLHPAQRESLLLTVIGWLLTAFAGSLGAPFWFDLLKKVSNLRASGPKPSQ